MRVIVPLIYRFNNEPALLGRESIIVNEPKFIYNVELDLESISPERYSNTDDIYGELLEKYKNEALQEAALKMLEDYNDLAFR